jgi:hypothetical protein
MKIKLIVSSVVLGVLLFQPFAEACEDKQKKSEAGASVSVTETAEQAVNKKDAARAKWQAKQRGEIRDRMSPEMRAKILEKFDADGDGQLNESERLAARKEMAERRKNRNI